MATKTLNVGSSASSITVDTQLNGNLLPQVTSTYNLGDSSHIWNNSYISNIYGTLNGAAKYLYTTGRVAEDSCEPDTTSRMQVFLTDGSCTAGGADGYITTFKWDGGSYLSQLYVDADPTYTVSLRFRDGSGNWTAWKKFLTEYNYNSYAPTLTGTGASGTWGISISGNAATATQLATARTIWGQSFNGTANISGDMYDLGTNLRLSSGLNRFQFLTSGSGAAKGSFDSIYIGTTYRNSEPDCQLRIAGASTGSSEINSSVYSLMIGTQGTRAASSGEYYPGIAFNHLLTYQNGTTYDNSPQAWIGIKLYDTPGSERSSLIFATKEGTGTTNTGTDIPTPRMCITPTGFAGINTTSPSYLLHINGGDTSTGVLAVTNYGYTTTYGNLNADWSHFQTTCSKFYINKPLYIDGACLPYTDNSKTLGDSSRYWSDIYTKGCIHAYRYPNANGLPVITFDKPGSYATGIGPDGTSNRIKFGPCDMAGSAWTSSSDFNSNQWYFQGTMYATNTVTFNAGIVAQHGHNFIVAGNEFNFIPDSYSNDVWLNYESWSRNSSSTVNYYRFGNGKHGYANGYFSACYGAVWNDYAEYRQASSTDPGRCVYELGDDTLALTTARMQPGAEIISDTFGFAIGETDECKTPIAASGRVLAYPYESREIFRAHIGKPVCSGPNGTVSIMTDEEYQKYGYCAIGTISAVPDYEEWGTGKVKVDGRVWIRIR